VIFGLVPAVTMFGSRVAHEPLELVTSPVKAGRRAHPRVPVRFEASVPEKKYPGETPLSLVQVMFGTLKVQSPPRVKPPKAPLLLY
jgi:hypothetical protein